MTMMNRPHGLTKVRRPIFRSSIAIAALLLPQTAVLAQNTGNSVSVDGLDIPANVELLGNGDSNVYRPTATVNGEIITATDVEQRLALVRMANQGQIPPEQLQALRLQIFGQLIDEMLQIQEARAAEIAPTDAEMDQQYERVAAGLRQTPQQFSQFLVAAGSSVASMRQQIRASLSWQNLLARNIDPFTNVSQEEVEASLARLESNRGQAEYRVGEIYLPANASNMQAVAENGRRIMEQLSSGEVSFQDMATRFSQTTSASVGGDLGWLRLSQLPASLAEAVQTMQPGQLAGPLESPGGVSILYLIDTRRVLTADPRDAVLSLKQITYAFPVGTTPTRAAEVAANFSAQTRTIAGCGAADTVAAALGAEVISRDQIALRDLPAPLQSSLAAMQIGQVTPMFGSPQTGVSVLVLCGRDMPTEATAPSADQVADQLRQERVQRRAERYLRDLRRDAVIDYGQSVQPGA